MKILITGANGFLGTKLVKILSSEFEVIGTSHEELDITDENNVFEFVKETKPSIIINPAAYANIDQCEINKETAYNVNVNGVKNLANACKEVNAKLIHFSTDFVFDGKKGNYSEEHKTNPVNYYGRTKLEAEHLIQESNINYIIARVCMLYGYNGDQSERSFVFWVYNNLEQGNVVNAFTDQAGTPTLIDDIALAITKLIKKDRKGIYHVSGPEKATRYEMALKIAETFKFSQKLIKPITSDRLKQAARRPKDTSLCISKLVKEGIKMSDVRSGLLKMKEQMQK